MNTISINVDSNTKFIENIIKLNPMQLSKVLEIGYSAYLGTIENIYQINNTEYTIKLKEIKEKHIKKIHNKQNEITQLNDLIGQIKISNQKNKELLIEEVKNNISQQYQIDLNYKNSKINELKEEISEYRNKIKISDDNKNQIVERIMLSNKKEIDDIRNTYQKKIDNLYEKISNFQTLNDNSYYKGKIGEQKMYNTLTMMFPKNEIIDTHGDPNRGDFLIVCDDEKKILIDNKDYSSNVPKKEIEKFHKDIEENIDVHSGILISNSSGIAKKDDFEINIINNKPVIYLCNTNKNKEKIKCATDFLKSLMKCSNIDFSNKEIIDKIKKLSSEFKRKINKIKKDIEKFSSSLQSTVLDIENIVKSVLLVYK